MPNDSLKQFSKDSNDIWRYHSRVERNNKIILFYKCKSLNVAGDDAHEQRREYMVAYGPCILNPTAIGARALESRVAELLESWVSKMTGDSDQTLHGLLNWFCCWIFPSVMEKVIVETSLRTFEVQVCLHIERHTWNENDLKNLKSQFKRKEFERQAIKHYFFLNFSRALHVDLFTAFF